MKCETISDLENFLKIQEQALGANAPEVAETATKLANLYKQAGRLEQAEQLYQRALSIREKLVGLHHDEVEVSKQNLVEVAVLKAAGKPQTVVDAIKQVANGTYKQEIPFEATISSTNLEPVKRSLPDINDAINDCRMEVELLRQMVGQSHPSVADILTKLADLYCRLRMYAEMGAITGGGIENS